MNRITAEGREGGWGEGKGDGSGAREDRIASVLEGGVQPWSHLLIHSLTHSLSHKDDHTHSVEKVHYGGENLGMECMINSWPCEAEGLNS